VSHREELSGGGVLARGPKEGEEAVVDGGRAPFLGGVPDGDRDAAPGGPHGQLAEEERAVQAPVPDDPWNPRVSGSGRGEGVPGRPTTRSRRERPCPPSTGTRWRARNAAFAQPIRPDASATARAAPARSKTPAGGSPVGTGPFVLSMPVEDKSSGAHAPP
jgi:hypothetical protein